ncbi:MAG: RNA polymerase sigma factor [Myxococcales bacterium]|nr:RNA polymerase sigma factor [Myxococcales bacterium]MCB9705613.1 RNA polymerase sigma factor [Myxococcales bacterium]
MAGRQHEESRAEVEEVIASADDDAERERILVERARAGQAAAWSRLYHDHYDRLLRDLTYLAGDVALAEDLVQETFIRALTCLARFDGRSCFASWLRGIGLNLIRQHWRSWSRRRRAHAHLVEIHARIAPPKDADPEGAELQRRRALALQAVLDTLPGHLREAFVFADLRRLPSSEAAALLGISAGNLRIRATRARARIHRELARLGWLTEGQR